MAIDSAKKRKSISGVGLFLSPGITPDTIKGADWRSISAGNYYIAVAPVNGVYKYWTGTYWKTVRLLPDPTNLDAHLADLDNPHETNGSNILVLDHDDETLDQFLDDVVGSGILDTITISEDGGLDVSWDTGEIFVEGVIYDTNADSATLTEDAANYIYGTSADLTVGLSDPGGERALIAIAWTHGGEIHQLLQYPNIHEFQEAINNNLDQTHHQMVHDGLVASEHTSDTTNANSVIVDTGSYFVKPFVRTIVGAVFYSSGQNSPWNENNMHRYFHTAGAWDVEYDNGVEFGVWDNGTDKTACNPAKWYCGFIFQERTDHVDYMFPQAEFLSEAAALEAPIVYPPFHEEFAIPVARFIFRGNAVAFDGTAYLVDARPIHGNASSGVSVAIQSLWKTITADTGSTIANASDDTLDIAGGVNISTAIAGDTVSVDLDITADVDFAGYKAVAMACDNGTSFPATPTTGQWFLIQVGAVGILCQYKGKWQPIISYSTTIAITSITVSGSDIIVTTSANHNLRNGDIISMENLGTMLLFNFNFWMVSAKTDTTFVIQSEQGETIDGSILTDNSDVSGTGFIKPFLMVYSDVTNGSDAQDGYSSSTEKESVVEGWNAIPSINGSDVWFRTEKGDYTGEGTISFGGKASSGAFKIYLDGEADNDNGVLRTVEQGGAPFGGSYFPAAGVNFGDENTFIDTGTSLSGKSYDLSLTNQYFVEGVFSRMGDTASGFTTGIVSNAHAWNITGKFCLVEWLDLSPASDRLYLSGTFGSDTATGGHFHSAERNFGYYRIYTPQVEFHSIISNQPNLIVKRIKALTTIPDSTIAEVVRNLTETKYVGCSFPTFPNDVPFTGRGIYVNCFLSGVRPMHLGKSDFLGCYIVNTGTGSSPSLGGRLLGGTVIDGIGKLSFGVYSSLPDLRTELDSTGTSGAKIRLFGFGLTTAFAVRAVQNAVIENASGQVFNGPTIKISDTSFCTGTDTTNTASKLTDAGRTFTTDITEAKETHTVATSTTVLTATGTPGWTSNEFIGSTLINITDGSTGAVTGNGLSDITCSAGLSGGGSNNFVAGDVCVVIHSLGVFNTTDGTFANITFIDSDTVVSLDTDIMDTSGDAYRVVKVNATQIGGSEPASYGDDGDGIVT